MNGTHITQTRQVKYLGVPLDTQLNYRQNTDKKKTAVLVSRNSKISTENKLKIYKTITKSIWTYGISLWGTAAMSHINKLESLQSKILRTIGNAPWYIRIEDIRKDLKIPTVKEEIGRYAEKYKERTATHPNQLAAEASKTLIERRLKRKHPTDFAKKIK